MGVRPCPATATAPEPTIESIVTTYESTYGHQHADAAGPVPRPRSDNAKNDPDTALADRIAQHLLSTAEQS